MNNTFKESNLKSYLELILALYSAGYFISISPTFLFHNPVNWVLCFKWAAVWLVASIFTYVIIYFGLRAWVAKTIACMLAALLLVYFLSISIPIMVNWTQTLDKMGFPRATGVLTDYSRESLKERTVGIRLKNGYGFRLYKDNSYSVLYPVLDATRAFQEISVSNKKWKFYNNAICIGQEPCLKVDFLTGNVIREDNGQVTGQIFQADLE